VRSLIRGSLCATCLAAALAAGCDGVSESKASSRPASEAPRTVRVVPAMEAAVPDVVAVSGTLAAEEEVVLGMKAGGKLRTIAVDLGSRVTRGQVLARLAPTDFSMRVQQADAALAQARARLGLAPGEPASRVNPEETSVVRQAEAVLTEARARRERAQALWEQKLLSRADLDAAEAGFRVAESRAQDAREEVLNRQGVLAQRRSEMDFARQQLSDTVLVAPFAGAVRERHATAGQIVAAGQPIVTLVRMHPLRLRLAVPERAAAKIRPGQEVRVSVGGDPNVHLGRIARLSPAIEESNRTLMIEAEVPNEGSALRPGTFASAEIVISSDRPIVVVPASAVVTLAGIEKVLTVKDGKSVETRVRTGRRFEDRTEIVEGLAAGESVVVEPGNLIGGQPVRVAQ
jgi:RND family efflux transporter MFP subunit